MPVAYSYIRFSTVEQLKGDSLRRQLELSKSYAEKHGFQLDESLTMRDLGLSAYHQTNIKRGELGVFLQAIKQGKVAAGSYLLVENLDRISRAKVWDALAPFREIIDAGVIIITLSDGVEYSLQSIEKNWTQLVMTMSIMHRSHEESLVKSKRLTAAWQNKLSLLPSKIMTKAIPSWLDIVGDKFVINQSKADIIIELFDLVRKGYGLHMIERKFNSTGVPTIGRSKRWYRSYLIKILKGRSVLGEFQPMIGSGGKRIPNGDPIPGYYPAIISEDDYYAAQNALSVRTNKGGRKGAGIANVFSGLCKCGYCGGTMRYENKGRTWQYLSCTNAKSGVGCKYVTWLYDEFSDTILSKLAAMDIDSVLQEGNSDKLRKKIESETAKLADVRKKLSRLIKLAEQTEDDEVVALVERLNELQAEEKLIKETLLDLEEEVQLPFLARKHFVQFKKLREALDSASGDDLINLRLRISTELKRLLTKIEIYPDGDQPWSFSMNQIGVKPGKEGRFAVVFFKSGEARVFHGVTSMVTIWPGPKTEEGVANAFSLPFSKKVTINKSDYN